VLPKCPAPVSAVHWFKETVSSAVVGFSTTILMKLACPVSSDQRERSLQRLIDDVVLRRQIGKHGRRHVIEHVSVATAIEQMCDVFEHVARAA